MTHEGAKRAPRTHAYIVHSRYANSGMIMCILGIPEIIVASILVYANNFACTALLLHAKTFYMNSALVVTLSVATVMSLI